MHMTLSPGLIIMSVVSSAIESARFNIHVRERVDRVYLAGVVGEYRVPRLHVRRTLDDHVLALISYVSVRLIERHTGQDAAAGIDEVEYV